MSDQYSHGLAADWRQRHAMSTACKVGSAYTGWAPSEPRSPGMLGLALLFGALLAVIVCVGGL